MFSPGGVLSSALSIAKNRLTVTPSTSVVDLSSPLSCLDVNNARRGDHHGFTVTKRLARTGSPIFYKSDVFWSARSANLARRCVP